MEEISHKATIVSITPQVTELQVIQSSACEACHARTMCSMESESGIRTVTIPTDPYSFYNVGDEVNLCLKATMGLKAVWLCYGIPLLILVLGIVLFSSLGFDELVIGAGSICLTLLYYLVIYLFRKRLANEYVFYIK